MHAQHQDATDFFRAFSNQRIANRPYKMLIAEGQWTCLIARFTGTMMGPMNGLDGNEIPPARISFDVDFRTVAKRDKHGQIMRRISSAIW